MERVNGREVDLQDILLLWLRKRKRIALCGAAAAAAALLVATLLIGPQYCACATLYVDSARSDQQTERLSEANLAASRRLVGTYIHIVESNRVLSRVAEQLDGDYSVKELREMLSAEQVEDTEILALYVIHPDAEEAARIANAVAGTAPAEIAEVIEGSSARVIDVALAEDAVRTPDPLKIGVLAAAIGLVLGAVAVTVRFLMAVAKQENRSVARDEDGVEDECLIRN